MADFDLFVIGAGSGGVKSSVRSVATAWPLKRCVGMLAPADCEKLMATICEGASISFT